MRLIPVRLTLPKTSISLWKLMKIGQPKRKFIFQPLLFRGKPLVPVRLIPRNSKDQTYLASFTWIIPKTSHFVWSTGLPGYIYIYIYFFHSNEIHRYFESHPVFHRRQCVLVLATDFTAKRVRTSEWKARVDGTFPSPFPASTRIWANYSDLTRPGPPHGRVVG